MHWGAYLCRPIAVLHGLGTGSDTKVRWVLLLTLACIALVIAVVGWRLAYGWPSTPVVRVAGALVVVLALIAGGAWLAAGPLQPGWARRAGTPPSILTAPPPGPLARCARPRRPAGRDDEHAGGRGRRAPADARVIPPRGLSLDDHLARYGAVPFSATPAFGATGRAPTPSPR